MEFKMKQKNEGKMLIHFVIEIVNIQNQIKDQNNDLQLFFFLFTLSHFFLRCNIDS